MKNDTENGIFCPEQFYNIFLIISSNGELLSEAGTFYLVCLDFTESCGDMQYLIGDGVLFSSLMILLKGVVVSI